MANEKWPFPSEPVDWLVARKFRNLDKLYVLGGLPDAPAVQLVQKKQYADELRQMAPAVLQSAYTHALREASKIEPGNKDLVERQLIYNLPRAKADFEHWSKMSYWTLEESTALSFGRDPEFINWKALESGALISSFSQDYWRIRELAHRAKHMGQLSDPVSPGFFIAWAKRNEITFSAELESRVKARGQQIADWKTHYDNARSEIGKAQDEIKKASAEMAAHREAMAGVIARKDELIAAQRRELAEIGSRLEAVLKEPTAASPPERPMGKERESLLKLVIGMAVEGYKFNPKAGRSDVTGEITKDLERAGVPLDSDTVRKWVREGADLLPPEPLQDRASKPK